jgi:hypothetical protein
VNVVVLDMEECVLYGFDTLERIIASGQAEKAIVLRGLSTEAHIAFLLVHFSDHDCVAALRGCENVATDQLKRISETIDFTEEQVNALRGSSRPILALNCGPLLLLGLLSWVIVIGAAWALWELAKLIGRQS